MTNTILIFASMRIDYLQENTYVNMEDPNDYIAVEIFQDVDCLKIHVFGEDDLTSAQQTAIDLITENSVYVCVFSLTTETLHIGKGFQDPDNTYEKAVMFIECLRPVSNYVLKFFETPRSLSQK